MSQDDILSRRWTLPEAEAANRDIRHFEAKAKWPTVEGPEWAQLFATILRTHVLDPLVRDLAKSKIINAFEARYRALTRKRKPRRAK